MQFRTEIPLKKQHKSINYSSKISLIGSCFTQNIGNKLAYFKFNHSVNPFGILFNPIAIENLIVSSLNAKKYTSKDLFFYNERWHCFDTHSDFSHTNQDRMLLDINSTLQQTKTILQSASHIIITLGTAWVYRYNNTNTIVANCHKLPQKQFSKELLSVKKIEASLKNIQNSIQKVNPNVTLIFTVSPVRHLKDGFIENQQSKAHLLTAIHQILHKNTCYFPAYEIMMDDLRDYRFYKKDMIHPNEIAIEYIWNKFVSTWINDSDTQNTLNLVNEIQKGLSHKPFNKMSALHQKFLKNLQKKILFLQDTKDILF